MLAGSAGPGGDGVLEVNVMKFICKEFWTEIFRKQIDKLQTNNQVGGRGAVCWWLGVLEANRLTHCVVDRPPNQPNPQYFQMLPPPGRVRAPRRQVPLAPPLHRGRRGKTDAMMFIYVRNNTEICIDMTTPT